MEPPLFQTLATKPPGDLNSLIALPPSPVYQPAYTNKPAYEPNGPPGIGNFLTTTTQGCPGLL